MGIYTRDGRVCVYHCLYDCVSLSFLIERLIANEWIHLVLGVLPRV